MFFFFFKQKTAYEMRISDWSSDVCSSDLTFYKDRQTKINDVIRQFTGPRNAPLSAEKAFQKIETMAAPKGDSKRLAEMMGTLSREERRDVAATIAARQIGRATGRDRVCQYV